MQHRDAAGHGAMHRTKSPLKYRVIEENFSVSRHLIRLCAPHNYKINLSLGLPIFKGERLRFLAPGVEDLLPQNHGHMLELVLIRWQVFAG